MSKVKALTKLIKKRYGDVLPDEEIPRVFEKTQVSKLGYKTRPTQTRGKLDRFGRKPPLFSGDTYKTTRYKGTPEEEFEIAKEIRETTDRSDVSKKINRLGYSSSRALKGLSKKEIKEQIDNLDLMVDARGQIVSRVKTPLKEKALKSDIEYRKFKLKKDIRKETDLKKIVRKTPGYNKIIDKLISTGEKDTPYPFSGNPRFREIFKKKLEEAEKYKILQGKLRYVDPETGLVEYRYNREFIRLEKSLQNNGFFSKDHLDLDHSLRLIREDRKAYANRGRIRITKEEQEYRRLAIVPKEKARAKRRAITSKVKEKDLMKALQSPERFIKGKDAEAKRRTRMLTLIEQGKIDPTTDPMFTRRRKGAD
tara:strand:- start:77 stop:1174 length:1098 start_codon:yes stop_codon:yes gene_type:complete